MSMFKKYFSAVKRVDDLEAEVADLKDRLTATQAKLTNESLRALERKVQGHSGERLYPVNPEDSLLKSDTNPCGWPLENLLVKILEEIEFQSDQIKSGDPKLKDELLQCNQAICESLRYATGVQHVALMHMRQN